MGLEHFGVPEKEVQYLRKSLNLDVFVEGGTFEGGTAKVMSKGFRQVYTIERSDEMFDIAKENLRDASNVTMLKGDTRDHLQSILEDNDNILFWLDAHWSGGVTYGEEDECPLLEELEIIFSSDKHYIVLIDDARLFLAPPPEPHDLYKWPTLSEIFRVLPQNWEIIEYEDVIYLLPKIHLDDFRTYLQTIVTEEHKKKNKNTLFLRILKRVGICD